MKLILVLVASLSSCLLVAQEWVKVKQLSTSSEYSQEFVSHIQFITPDVGYYATGESTTGSSPGETKLYMTQNSGLSWYKKYSYSGDMGTSARMDFHFLNENDYIIYKSAGISFCDVYRDNLEDDLSIFSPDILPYGRNISTDTVVGSDYNMDLGEYYIAMILLNEDTVKRVPISNSYVFNEYGESSQDKINKVCFISGFGAATGVRDDKNYFYHSEENLDVWSSALLPTEIQPENVYFIDKNVGFIVSAGGVLYRTENTGKDWTKVTFSETVKVKQIEFSDSKGYIAGFNGLVYSTTDKGETWGKETFPNTNDLYELSVVGDIAYIVDSKGMLYTNNPKVSMDENKQQVDTKVYPNPCLDVVNISFPEIIVSYVIYDNTGKLIQSVSEVNSTSVVINMAELHSGCYFVKVIGDAQTSIKKIVKI